VNSNIFHSKKGDAVAYLIFYISFPIAITYLSLKVFPEDVTSGVYCYVTFLVSILNNLYDAANRWDYGAKTKRNSKIFFMYVFDVIAGIYCLYIVLSVLVTHDFGYRNDIILCAYIVTCLIALWDIVATFARETTLTKAIADVGGD